MSVTHYPHGILATPNLGGWLDMFAEEKIYFVDGDFGSDGNNGKEPKEAKATIQSAVTAAGSSDGAFIYIKAKDMAAGETDPGSYAENIVVPATAARMSMIGVSVNRTQGGLPQLKVGTTTTQAILTVRSPGFYFANLGVNGNGGTGGGIKLDDDGSTKTAFGTTIDYSHFKNCVGPTATNASTGAAIMLAGAPWQVRIRGNEFYKNVGGILATPTYSDLQDLVIEDNVFAGTAATVDCDIYAVAGGAGMLGVAIRNNDFGCVDKPTLGGTGANQRYIIATGCTGILAGNNFACLTGPTGQTELTFGVAGTAGKIPATMRIAGNFGESLTAGETGEIDRTD